MRRVLALIIIAFSAAFSAFFTGCVTDTASLKIEKTLPQNKLAYYNDSFDNFRTELWEKAGYIPNEVQKANFKLAKVGIKDGKFSIETETGCFSKGGLGSKYSLRGDFDIQVDCRTNFLEFVYDMDQLLIFGVLDKGSDLHKLNSVFLGLLKQEGNDYNMIFSLDIRKGKIHRENWDRRANRDIFDGTFRIVRIEDKISTLFKTKGDVQWKEVDTFRSIPNDVMIGFNLGNFTSIRTSITAKTPITATFDNFRINAAEEIIENDI